MSATLDTRSLKWQEGWFKVSDGSTSLATDGPYVMKKVQKVKNINSHKVRYSNSVGTAGLTNNVGLRSRNHVLVSDGISVNQHGRIWNIETFDDLTNKLMSGSDVYMVVDATQCSKSGYSLPDRFHFGTKIDNFEILLDKRKFHGDLLKMSSLKKVLHDNDVYEILREVKVYRDGTVIIDYYIIDSFSNHITQQSLAVCRIYNSHNKDGHVRFSSNPFEDIKSIKSFGSLRSSLRKGRETKMIVDLTKCSNMADKTTIIGGTLKDYDFLDSGNTIAVTFTTLHSSTEIESIISSQNAFVMFSNGNSMTLTLKSQNISKNYSAFSLNKTIKYRCTIGKDYRKNGLALFYT